MQKKRRVTSWLGWYYVINPMSIAFSIGTHGQVEGCQVQFLIPLSDCIRPDHVYDQNSHDRRHLLPDLVHRPLALIHNWQPCRLW